VIIETGGPIIIVEEPNPQTVVVARQLNSANIVQPHDVHDPILFFLSRSPYVIWSVFYLFHGFDREDKKKNSTDMCMQQHISKPRNPIFNQPTVMDTIRSGLQMRRICAPLLLLS
jgi:hypothetical protein